MVERRPGVGLDTGTARERHVSERRMRVCPAVARDCVCVSGVWWEVATFSGYDLLGNSELVRPPIEGPEKARRLAH